MSKNLVIVESPAKWKTIEKFLWNDFKVVASMWHIRDLPEKTLGIDIENWFIPEYLITEEKKKTVKDLQKLAKSHPNIWIATDEDREWEAIGWHLCHVLWLDPENVKRIVFHEITKEAILNSIKNPRNIDINLVDAQQARRLLDRLVWYKVSPILWKKIRKWLSAWRVQSVAVKLIVEKEREIKNFKPEESWKIIAELEYNKSKFKTLFTKLNGKNKNFKSIEDVKKFLHVLFEDISSLKEEKNKTWNTELSLNKSLNFKLNSVDKKDSKRSPWAPFTTSTLQQEASRKFGFSVKQTMMIAQKLYEWVDLWNGERTGLITYMRTDSVNLSDNALWQASTLIIKNFWKEYLKIRKYKTKSAGAQEAHEAIRPTYLSQTPESLSSILDPQALKLYTLIWKRTLASQMEDAIVEITTFNFSPENKVNQEWITKWEVIKFDWFMKLYVESTDDENENNENAVLPSIEVWTLIPSAWVNWIQSFSKPPARYTEASLVKKLESEGIWRPSTYAPIISTIIDRWYVEKVDKKYLSPTDIAFTVNDFLQEYFKEMMDYGFTRNIEEEFDKIAEWKMKYDKMLEKFWLWTLKKDIENAWKNAEKVIEMVWKPCPKCGKDLIFRYSKTWKFIGCSGYPKCDYIEQPKEESDKLQILRDKYEWKPCPDWIDGTIVVKIWRFGPFLASSKYPEVKRIWKIVSEKDEILEQILKEKWLLIDEETWEELVIKNSKKWPFLAAKKYPEVKIAKNIPKSVWDELKIRMEKSKEEN